MQSKVSNAGRYRVPAAGRYSVLSSLIPIRLAQGSRAERWPKPPRAVTEDLLLPGQKSEDSSGDIVTDEAVSREVTQTSQLKPQGTLVPRDEEAGGLDPSTKVQEVRTGVVRSVDNYRVFVDIGAGVDGLLSIKHMSDKRPTPKDIKRMFSVGDEIKVFVLHVEHSRQSITLSTKGLELNPGDMLKDPQLVYENAEEGAAKFIARIGRTKEKKENLEVAVDPNLKVNDLRSGVVKSVKKYGVMVDIGAGPIGLLPKTQISHKRVDPYYLKKIFTVGEEIKVMVLTIEPDEQQVITLNTRVLEVKPGDMLVDPQLVYSTAEQSAAAFLAMLAARKQEKAVRKEKEEKERQVLREKAAKLGPELKVNELRSGVIQAIKKYGVFVDIGAGPPGWLHTLQISRSRMTTEDVKKTFSIGDKIKVMVHQLGTGPNQQGLTLGTKHLEVKPGDMLKDPQLVYSTAEEMAAAYQTKFEARQKEKEKEREKAKEVEDSKSKPYWPARFQGTGAPQPPKELRRPSGLGAPQPPKELKRPKGMGEPQDPKEPRSPRTKLWQRSEE